jgi:hypothetical protein
MVFQTAKDINVEFHRNGNWVLDKKKSQQPLGSNFLAEREGINSPSEPQATQAFPKPRNTRACCAKAFDFL